MDLATPTLVDVDDRRNDGGGVIQTKPNHLGVFMGPPLGPNIITLVASFVKGADVLS